MFITFRRRLTYIFNPMLWLILVFILIFKITYPHLTNDSMLLHYGGLSIELSKFRLYIAVFTNILLHANLQHLIVNCVILYITGAFLQMIPIKSSKQYLLFFSGAIGSSGIWLAYAYLTHNTSILLGISGGVMCLLTYCTIIFLRLVLQGVDAINDVVYNQYGNYELKFGIAITLLIIQLISMYFSNTQSQLVVHYAGSVLGAIFALIDYHNNFI